MAQFGWYTHLHWKNYMQAGTYQVQTAWDRQNEKYGQKNNFNRNIFKQHRQDIENNAKKFKTASLKALEERYNNQQKDVLNFLKLLDKTKTSDREVLTLLLSLVNKSWSESQVEEILNHLKETPAGFKYAGTKFQGNYTSEKVVKKIKSDSDHYIKPLIAKIDELIKQFQQSDIDDEEKTKIIFDLQKQRVGLVQIAKGVQDISKTLNRLEPFGIDQQELKEYGSGKLNKEQAKGIIESINQKIDIFNTTEVINSQLAYRIPEILGELIANKITEITQKEIEQLFINLKTKSQSQQLTTRILDMPKVFNKFDNSVLIDKAKKEIKGPNGDSITYELREVGSDIQQKTDIIFEGHNISMKTTSLSYNPEKAKSDIFEEIPHISLQNSSLFLYLMGIESYKEYLGTHYINILTEHEDEDNIYSSMRAQANESLSLYILYSALTGEGQLRQGKFASIFAISDKRTGKVKFLDVYDIIHKINNGFGNGVIFSPHVDTISITNKQEGKVLSRKAAYTRVSKILTELRNQNIAAALTKQFLTSV